MVGWLGGLLSDVMAVGRETEDRLCSQYKTPSDPSLWTRGKEARAVLERELKAILTLLEDPDARRQQQTRDVEVVAPSLAELFLSCSFEEDAQAYQKAKNLAIGCLQRCRQLEAAVQLARKHSAWSHLAQVSRRTLPHPSIGYPYN